ncbi:MAG: S8 family peptidase [Xanthomonadales bacterium]|nr:S8 family peptidase [Xanthomonadales bacterium]
MVDVSRGRLPHILIKDTAVTHMYTRPLGGGRLSLNLPERNRQSHAEHLLTQLNEIQEKEADLISYQKAIGLDAGWGIYLAFESEPGFDLKFGSLEYQRSGIELCAIKQIDGKTIATVFVPEGKLSFFLNRTLQYLEEDTAGSNPKHKDLIEGISEVKLAVLEALWTDNSELFPEADQVIWWEIWLRHTGKVNHEDLLRQHAGKMDLHVSDEAIHFLDRTVLLVRGTRGQIAQSIQVLGIIAELRFAKETADFYTRMDRIEQREWIDDALKQLVLPPDNAPTICILDTGVTEQHPLLRPIASASDMHTYDPAWGTDDRNGHGTPMAGLAIYGDLTQPLSSGERIELTHRLESVKISPDPGQHTDKLLYGAITSESINRVEINPNRQRVFAMAITASDDRDRGRPSSWSATIDSLSYGSEDEQQRLVILSAGNTDPRKRHNHPDSNMTDAIHDPGQAWNALTIGAFTEKALLDEQRYHGWYPVANSGDIGPSSCTSMEWGKTAWPVKPDIVMEGGNMAINPVDGTADYIDDALQLLSTGHQFAIGKQLVSFGDTSGATALAARLAAMVQAQYPECWPETLRALLVHSAQWTDAMKSHFSPLSRKDDYRQLLRFCGYGTPNEEALFWSTQSALTLIAQDNIQPYFKDKGGIKTKDINIHQIPWPTEILNELGETPVEMKVTLSYFIEPNPGARGWASKYRYASHGLRFDVKRPLENFGLFQQRINKQARDEEYSRTATPDSGNWTLGKMLRNLGSIHSDTWNGTAAELAERGHVAVYPVVGWWKERANLQRWGNQARYALIISIRTPDIETNIYTPIINQIGIPVEIRT